MTDRKDLLQLSFYRLSPFFGSNGDTRYKIEKIIEKIKISSTGSQATVKLKGYKIEKEDDHFKLTTWPGPYSFDNTDESLMHYETFEFTDEGLQQIVDYLNQKDEENP